MVVALEVDGLAVLPGDGTQTSPGTGIRTGHVQSASCRVPWGSVVAWHDGTRSKDSRLVLQQVEEHNGVVKSVHAQHVVLVGDLRVLH